MLQAFVSEGLKPLIDRVVTFGAGHFYVSQSDKGGLVFGGDIDGYNSYAQRGNLPVVEDVVEARHGVDARRSAASACCAHWGGVMDMSMDGSPIIDRTPFDGLYLNAGWCYGGFKATPASGLCFAHLIARDEPHPAAPRFVSIVSARPSHRREGRRRPTQPSLGASDGQPHPCPHCGARPRENSLSRARATAAEAGRAMRTPWFEYVYVRENPRGPHEEYWHHTRAAAVARRQPRHHDP